MRKLFLTIVALLFMTVVAAAPAMAVGTLAGTAISNQAYGDYKDANGNVMPQVLSNKITITVSQVAGVFIDPPTASQAVSLGQTVTYLAQLFNTGNGPDTQTFSYASSGAWSPVPDSVKMYYDVNNNHTYDLGTDILLTEISPNTFKTTVSINPDDDYDLLMQFTVPMTALPGQQNQIVITTHSDFDPTKTATGTYTTTVLAAAISAVKTHTPVGTPTYLSPGQEITYTITLTNSGNADATGVTFTDPIPANLTYKPGSLMINTGSGFVAKTDGADSDGVQYVAGTHSITLDGPAFTVAHTGGTWAVRFTATLNSGTPSGSAVSNQASITYTSGAFNPTIQTNGDTFLVSTAATIDLSSTATNATGNPSDKIVYPFTATNNGNANDIIELTVASTSGWTWAIWADADGNGIPGTGGDYLLTDTDGDGKVDTNSLALNGGSIALLAVATIPPGTANGTTDTLTISGVSHHDPTKTDSLTFTTTVKAPVLSMTKTLVNVVQPAGITPPTCVPTNPSNPANPPNCMFYPGTVVTYQVTATNNGNGNATDFVITDLVPLNTTYKTGTIRTGSNVGTLVGRTDAADGDGGTFDSGSDAVISGPVPALGPTGTWVLEFQVTIK